MIFPAASSLTFRGLFSKKTNPTASAPASTAISASSRFVIPQILIQVIRNRRRPSVIGKTDPARHRRIGKVTTSSRAGHRCCRVVGTDVTGRVTTSVPSLARLVYSSIGLGTVLRGFTYRRCAAGTGSRSTFSSRPSLRRSPCKPCAYRFAIQCHPVGRRYRISGHWRPQPLLPLPVISALHQATPLSSKSRQSETRHSQPSAGA
jgi:hypothetical protein